MIEILAILLLSSYFDGKRDKTNSGANKWPFKGFVVTTQGVWQAKHHHLVRGRTLLVVDPWHVTKWLAFYPPLIYIWWQLPWSWMAVMPPICWMAWRVHPKPEHWNGD